jgi:hypothetical protein
MAPKKKPETPREDPPDGLIALQQLQASVLAVEEGEAIAVDVMRTVVQRAGALMVSNYVDRISIPYTVQVRHPCPGGPGCPPMAPDRTWPKRCWTSFSSCSSPATMAMGIRAWLKEYPPHACLGGALLASSLPSPDGRDSSFPAADRISLDSK